MVGSLIACLQPNSMFADLPQFKLVHQNGNPVHRVFYNVCIQLFIYISKIELSKQELLT